MLTFLPQVGYADTARRLLDAQLEAQCEQAWGILEALESGEGKSSLAVQMWRGYERSLCIYGLTMCLEWRIGRRHTDGNMGSRFAELDDELKRAGLSAAKPPWLGKHEVDIQRSHRSNLLRRWPEYGSIYSGSVPELMPMIYPQNLRDGGYRLRLSSADADRLAHGERKLPNWLKYDTNKREIIHI